MLEDCRTVLRQATSRDFQVFDAAAPSRRVAEERESELLRVAVIELRDRAGIVIRQRKFTVEHSLECPGGAVLGNLCEFALDSGDGVEPPAGQGQLRLARAPFHFRMQDERQPPGGQQDRTPGRIVRRPRRRVEHVIEPMGGCLEILRMRRGDRPPVIDLGL